MTTNLGISDTQVAQIASIDTLAAKAGQSIQKAFAGGVAQGKQFDAVLKTVGDKLAGLAQAGFAQAGAGAGLQTNFGALLPSFGGGQSLFGGLDLGALFASALPSAKGNVVSAPTYFPLGGGLGVMGEAGSEAIMPLSRGADGSLGVRAAAGASPVQVTMHVNASDAQSFRQSEAQITAALARAVARGQRGL
jgi:phage-related minor tail protein